MKHTTVRDYLEGLVEHLEPGSRIPSERELCEQFGVSRMTVRQAVDALVVAGVLQRVQGRGTFVSRPRVDMQLRLTAFDDEMRRRHMSPSSRVLRADSRPAPAEVATALEIPAGDAVYYLYRVRLADGVPMSLEENWAPAALLPGLLEPAPPSSLYAAFLERGFPPSWGEDTIEATVVRAPDADLLGLPDGGAGLRITRRTFSSDVAIGYSRSLYRGDRYALWAPVSPPSPALAPPRREAPARRTVTPGAS